MSLSMWLDKTATHQRQTAVKDAIGGNVPTWATQNAGVPVAVWPSGSSLVRELSRRDLIGDYAIVTDSDLGVVSGDRFVVSGVYYTVNGIQTFENAFAGSELVYLIDVTRRNQ